MRTMPCPPSLGGVRDAEIEVPLGRRTRARREAARVEREAAGQERKSAEVVVSVEQLRRPRRLEERVLPGVGCGELVLVAVEDRRAGRVGESVGGLVQGVGRERVAGIEHGDVGALRLAQQAVQRRAPVQHGLARAGNDPHAGIVSGRRRCSLQVRRRAPPNPGWLGPAARRAWPRGPSAGPCR